MAGLTLQELSGTCAVARLPADAAIPAWADGPGFVSITRTAQELSIICDAARTPVDIRRDGPWTCFQLLGPFDLALSGIAVQVMAPVSQAGIGLLFVTTFDTDYLLVRTAQREAAVAALRAAGLTVRA